MEKISKKDMILDAALTLFSQKGYDGVGVDEIAAAVNMKGPALYHYFKGKEGILDALIETNDEKYKKQFGNAEHIEHFPATLEEFVEGTMGRLQYTIHDPSIKKVRRMLAMEQFRNDKIRALTTEHHITVVENLNRIYFEKLIEQGAVKPYDPQILAYEFTAPVTMQVHLIDREPDKEAEAMDKIRKHMEHFIEVYSVK